MPTAQAPVPVESVRAGSRWLHAMPSEQDVRDWFDTQRLHPGMDHAPYVSGLVLIGAKEKVNTTRMKHDGNTYVQEMEQAVFVPYVKVDTRIAYFRDYVRLLNGVEIKDPETEKVIVVPQEFGDYYGVIRPVAQRQILDESSAYFNGNLPAGYGVYAVRNNAENISRYLVATFEAVIFRRQSGAEDQLVLRGQGSKQIAMKRNFADDNAVMKAETGAIGRALGVCGMLVIGTGVATAEDMQEALSQPSGASTGATGAQAAVLPPVTSDVTTEAMIAEVTPPPTEAVDAIGPEEMRGALEMPDDDEERRALAVRLRQQMQGRFPNTWDEYTRWWAERGHPTLDELEGPALKGVLLKLERMLDERVRAGKDSAAVDPA